MSTVRIRTTQPQVLTAPLKAEARIPVLVKRQTCEGCAFLTRERPRCLNEASPHFRSPRESYHDKCGFYGPSAHAGRET